jgi:hypothetical protein
MLSFITAWARRGRTKMAIGTIQRPSEDFAKCVGCTLPFESAELDDNQRCGPCATGEATLAAIRDIVQRAGKLARAEAERARREQCEQARAALRAAGRLP